jgi:hypothetical protein
VFFYNKGTGNIVWSVNEMQMEDGPMKQKASLFEEKPQLCKSYEVWILLLELEGMDMEPWDNSPFLRINQI